MCCMFTICMLMPAGVRAEEGENENAKVLNQITLSVGDEQKTPVYKAGEKTELKINVQNKGNIDAQNVMITPVINSTDEWPFDMEKLNYEQDLGTIAAGAQATALWGGDDDKLTVKSDVTGKSYKLVFRFICKFKFFFFINTLYIFNTKSHICPLFYDYTSNL